MTPSFGGCFAGKTVFLTGHTGFKGTWLSTWLVRLGARVVGYSRDIPTQPSMFEETGLASHIEHHFGDVTDYPALSAALVAARPDYVFHLAAQAIVSTSYADPLGTFSTNLMGTANVMQALRQVDWPCIAVMITSDKCYENVEWVWGYRETDAVGGKDIYSGSKGAAEIAIHSFHSSFFGEGRSPVRIGVARAGNVIGGGDWAADRIVADCMRAWSQDEVVEIRSPSATRPWQHVLEPLSGYLALAQALGAKPELDGEPFNFGPRAEINRTVSELLQDLATQWGEEPDKCFAVTGNVPFHEAGLLKLNCDKALFHLRWEANLAYAETVAMIAQWYRQYYHERADMHAVTHGQIERYEVLARERGRSWAS